jgi:hypothetical protein
MHNPFSLIPVAPVAPVALVALTALASLAGAGCTIACNELGCPTGVEFQLNDAVSAFSGELPLTLRLCADTVCGEFTISQDAQGAVSCAPVDDTRYLSCSASTTGPFAAFIDADVDDDKATASLQVKNQAGDSLFEDTKDVTITPSSINGDGCGETCRSGKAEFTPMSK